MTRFVLQSLHSENFLWKIMICFHYHRRYNFSSPFSTFFLKSFSISGTSSQENGWCNEQNSICHKTIERLIEKREETDINKKNCQNILDERNKKNQPGERLKKR